MVHAPQAALDIIEMTSSTPGVMGGLDWKPAVTAAVHRCRNATTSQPM